MKKVSILVGVLLVTIVSVSCHHEELPEEFKLLMQACSKKLGISEEEHEEAMKKNDFTDPKFHCLSECTMTESGILVGDEIKVEKVKELVKSFKPDLSDAEMEEVHEKCDVRAHKKEDRCDMTAEYQDCFEESIHKARK